jgi:hypothetical protein
MSPDEHRAKAEEALVQAEHFANALLDQSAYVWIELARTHILLADSSPQIVRGIRGSGLSIEVAERP